MLNCLDAAQQHTNCLPRSFDVEEMSKDVKMKIVVEQLKQQFTRRNKKEAVESTPEPILAGVS
jgi:hypothetical protein